MDPARAAVMFYALFWAIRINGCVRRGRQPLLRGPEWFFTVHVRRGFYDGPGKQLLRWYWMRMMIPFAVDIPIAGWIILSSRFVLLDVLVIAQCALIHVNHLISVDLAERQARPFALPEPVASLLLSLTPRRLRHYVNWRVELALVLTTVVAWRAPVPREHAEAYIAVQETKRKYYLASIDWYRALLTAQLVVWSVHPGLSKVNFAVWFVIGVVGTIVVEIKRKQLAIFALRARPVRLPDFLRQSEMARWPVCYQPSAPLLMLKGARGYSINLANTCAVMGLAYVAGFIMVLERAL
jgi:hypothetical protein